ncbi:MAG: hypothetical protein MJ156_00825 [Alphaproteobacteria bacterium]|nr:hypothetical protein [Alphaproteobacteria bacterium]
MKKYLLFFSCVLLAFSANAESVIVSDTSLSSDNEENVSDLQITGPEKVLNYLSNDTSDPLFLLSKHNILSDTAVSYIDEKVRLGETIAYGITNSLSIMANLLYQFDFSHDKQNGFSSFDIGGVYRMNHGRDSSKVISDALFGLKVGGSEHVRSPEYADSSYYAGLRFGRQWSGISLSGTIKSTWVFDESRGLSYIDFIPESYFRINKDWRVGLGLDFRVSTNKYLLPNQDWANFKFVRQYGNTQYVGRVDYEFEKKEVQIGANIKIMF